MSALSGGIGLYISPEITVKPSRQSVTFDSTATLKSDFCFLGRAIKFPHVKVTGTSHKYWSETGQYRFVFNFNLFSELLFLHAGFVVASVVSILYLPL